MMTIDKHTVGIWVITRQDQDWLASIREEDGKFKLIYRFRYYVDNKIFEESNDIKSWTSMNLTGIREEILFKIRTLFLTLAERMEGNAYEVINDGDFETFYNKFMDLPPIHGRMVR
jgi:hypothetical protein